MSIRKLMCAATAVTLILSGGALADLELKPYGDAQYRFRGALLSASDDDNSHGTANYSNVYSWRTGIRAKVDDQLSLQFQLGNDWGAAEAVQYRRIFKNSTVGNVTTPVGRNAVPVLLHLAYGTWNPGMFFISAGVVPVSSHGSLDLLESSLNSGGSYAAASYDGWATRTNSSMPGVKIGAPIVKGDVKVGAELLTSITESRSASVASNTPVPDANPDGNYPAMLFVLDVPVSTGDLKVTPQIAMVINRHYDKASAEGDHEMVFGTSAAYKINDQLSVNAIFAYGMNSNENSNGGSGYSDMSGMILGVGGSYKVGPGTAQLEYKMSTTENGEVKNSDEAYHYIDARYTMRVHSKFSIAPRWRTYITTYNKDARNGYSFMENRPELIFTASF